MLRRRGFTTSRRVGGRGGREAPGPVTGGVAASSADLGGSSEYTSETLVGRSGEGFRENGSRSRVSRS